MTKEITISRETIDAAERNLAERLDRLGPIAERLQRVLGLDDPKHKSFFDLKILSALVGERVVGQLPNDGMGDSVKTYTVLGCIAGLVEKMFNNKLAAEPNGSAIADELLIQSLADVFKDKCLVGPTSGSYGIALYIIAEKLREKCGINVKALPLFGADIPPGKLEIIEEYHRKEWGALPLVEALSRETREQDSLNKLVEIVLNGSNTIDGGFFVPTNPLSMADLEKLTTTIISSAKNLREVPEWKQDILSNLGIAVDPENNTLTINTAYADHAAGTELFATAILEAFPNARVNVLYPISAGAGAMGPLRQAEKHSDHMHILLAPDPANPSWQEHRTVNEQSVFENVYVQPAEQADGTDAKATNGMGSKAQAPLNGDAVTTLVEEGVANNRAEFLPVTDVMRQVARAITTLDELHHNFGKKIPIQELASATSAGALLTRAVENADSDEDVRRLAHLATKEIFRYGINERQFLQLCFREEPRNKTSNVAKTWGELEKLAEIQGRRIDKDSNRVLIFMQELHAAFIQFSATSGLASSPEEKSSEALAEATHVTVIPITGRNSGITVAVRPAFAIEQSWRHAEAA